MSDVNEALRDHVTRTGFDLSLGKTHIATLVWIDLRLKDNRPGKSREQTRPFSGRESHSAFKHHATGAHGLIDRGLVEHILESRRRPGERTLDMTPRRVWRITPAGRLVVNLLKEAGLYQEYEALLPVVVVREEAS